MISVTADGNGSQRSNHSTTTPAPRELPPAVSSSSLPALLQTLKTLSMTPSPSPHVAAQQKLQSITTPVSATSVSRRSESESLEWQPSISNSDHRNARHEAIDTDDFNAFAARNTRTYMTVGKNGAKFGAQETSRSDDTNNLSNGAPRTQKVLWDDHIEFPGPTSVFPQKQQVTSISDQKGTTASIWADQETSPVSDSLTSSTNSKKWSSRQGPQRLSSRLGTVRQKQPETTTTSTTTEVEGVRQDEKLGKSYEDAVSEIESQSGGAGGGDGGGASSAENDDDTLVNARLRGKTSGRNSERLSVKSKQKLQVKDVASSKPVDRQKVSLRIKISPVEQTQSQRWSDAKVSQYFRWESPDKSSERLVEETEEADDQSNQELRKEVKSSSLDDTSQRNPVTKTTTRITTARPNINRFGAIKGTTKTLVAKQRQQSKTTTTLAPEYESEEEEFVTQRSITTTRQPQLESLYQTVSHEAAKKPVRQQQQQQKQRLQESAVKQPKGSSRQVTASAKAQSLVQSSGRGYEWSTDIDHGDERPAEIKSSTYRVQQEDNPSSTSARFTNPTTISTSATPSTTVRPIIASGLQTKKNNNNNNNKQTATSQRQSSITVVKKYSYDEVSSVSSIDASNDDYDQETGKFQKKSGVQYSPSSVEREDDVSVDKEINKKSGEQGSGDPDDPENCRLEDSIPGIPLTDYPTYSQIPMTTFKCSDQTLPGYYGDVEAQCQVFHVCQADGRKNDFLCPVGTIFNQELFVCDWWQNFRCQDTPNFYVNNDLLYRTPVKKVGEIGSNQLRKRTDAIEREDDPPFSDEVRSEDSYDNTSEDSGSSAVEEEDDAETLSPFTQTTRRPLGASVKGVSEKQRNSEPTVQRKSASIKSSARASSSSSYGARVASLSRKGEEDRDSVAAAASKSHTTISPNSTDNHNNRTQNTAEVMMKMSTSALPLPVN